MLLVRVEVGFSNADSDVPERFPLTMKADLSMKKIGLEELSCFFQFLCCKAICM